MCTIKLFKYKPNKSIKIARITKKIIIKQANQVGHFGIFLSSEISIKNDSTNSASLKFNRTKGFWWSIYIHLFKYKKKNPSLNAWIIIEFCFRQTVAPRCCMTTLSHFPQENKIKLGFSEQYSIGFFVFPQPKKKKKKRENPYHPAM